MPESSYYGSGISAFAPCILCTNAIQLNTIHSTGGVPYIWGAIAGCIATIIFFKIKYSPILGEGIRVREKASQDRLILGGSVMSQCSGRCRRYVVVFLLLASCEEVRSTDCGAGTYSTAVSLLYSYLKSLLYSYLKYLKNLLYSYLKSLLY